MEGSRRRAPVLVGRNVQATESARHSPPAQRSFEMIRTFALLVVGLLALAPVVAAHPGHGHKVMGVVSTIHENQLVVKDAKDKETTFTLDAKTKITRGRTALRSSEIKVGDRVVV